MTNDYLRRYNAPAQTLVGIPVDDAYLDMVNVEFLQWLIQRSMWLSSLGANRSCELRGPR